MDYFYIYGAFGSFVKCESFFFTEAFIVITWKKVLNFSYSVSQIK